MTFAQALNRALAELLAEDARVVLLGEDLVDPYGGAFKVTRGLSTAFPTRVRSTPVSEAAIAGVAAGLALAGMRPIAEIMFGDFLTLTFDQVVNHIAKYEAMYDGKATCPVIIRSPSGGHRGYGPTHSQSLEKHFLGVPHLRVVASSLLHDPKAVLADLLAHDAPALHIEHKLLYPRRMMRPDAGRLGAFMVSESASDGRLPTMCLSLVPREECRLTVLGYGYTAVLAMEVIERLAMQEELFCELLVPAELAPMDWGPVEASVAETGALLTVEEGTAGWSWGTEAAHVIGRRLFGRLRRPVEVLASARDVIPSARAAEATRLVGPHHIEAAIRGAIP